MEYDDPPAVFASNVSIPFFHPELHSSNVDTLLIYHSQPTTHHPNPSTTPPVLHPSSLQCHVCHQKQM